MEKKVAIIIDRKSNRTNNNCFKFIYNEILFAIKNFSKDRIKTKKTIILKKIFLIKGKTESVLKKKEENIIGTKKIMANMPISIDLLIIFSVFSLFIIPLWTVAGNAAVLLIIL